MYEIPKLGDEESQYDGSRIFTWFADMCGVSVDLVSTSGAIRRINKERIHIWWFDYHHLDGSCDVAHRIVWSDEWANAYRTKTNEKTCSYLRWNESACKIPPNWVYCLKARLYCIQRAKIRIQVHMVLFSVKNSRTHTPTGGKEKKHCALAVRMQRDKQNVVLFCFEK